MRECVLVVVALALFSSAPSLGEPTRESSPRPSAPNVRPTPPDADLTVIRDIFRYDDEPAAAPTPSGEPVVTPAVPEGEAASPPPARSRLIGLVQRSGRSVAAVFIDGEVLLLGEGESAAGFTVTEIREERIRLRDPDGNEETLELP